MKITEIEIVSLFLNEFRKNLAAPGKLLLRCSTTGTPDRYVPVGDQPCLPYLP